MHDGVVQTHLHTKRTLRFVVLGLSAVNGAAQARQSTPKQPTCIMTATVLHLSYLEVLRLSREMVVMVKKVPTKRFVSVIKRLVADVDSS